MRDQRETKLFETQFSLSLLSQLIEQWKQIAANLVILVATNLVSGVSLVVFNSLVLLFLMVSAQVGLFIHNLTEEGQRRAFLDTRDCIAARLEMEDENEKLERLLLSVLPQHVAVEMKGDIMSPVEVR